MRLPHLVLAVVLCGGLGACNTDTGPNGRSALSETFDTGNYRQSSNTNGTQTRRDVNRQYTAPSLPSIMFRGN
ncbi:hypothetical protein ASG40_18585 [Methylobacterium sp. Leaf399]|uniref:hypothetical protein n=1 Tax=unclassified Methylobacterium TaxID=2615210 RepID=UPI0006F8908E|nr:MULTISPECIES: hypothetical protein [unclassified Methylobacterium]KQP48934.1 hypothetical protein ASF39_14360 [Methylobacterium sp. Leaf108]KQT15588.1 hypothetical protein ASG40_18585 [Methylobacterium sp. Leaf399]KQT83350.1 hypothetical protein ASG59_18090 [Methylobacterium sp. Leaf466]